MRNLPVFAIFFLAALIAVACGEDRPVVDLQPIEDEIARHEEALASTADLPAARSETATHAENMTTGLFDVQATLDDMKGDPQCTHQGIPMTVHMERWVIALGGAVERHRTSMDAATEMDDSKTERDRYIGDALRYLKEMHAIWTSVGTRCGGALMGSRNQGRM